MNNNEILLNLDKIVSIHLIRMKEAPFEYIGDKLFYNSFFGFKYNKKWRYDLFEKKFLAFFPGEDHYIERSKIKEYEYGDDRFIISPYDNKKVVNLPYMYLVFSNKNANRSLYFMSDDEMMYKLNKDFGSKIDLSRFLIVPPSN